MLNCYNFAILPPQSLEQHTNKYRLLGREHKLIIQSQAHKESKGYKTSFFTIYSTYTGVYPEALFLFLIPPSFLLTSHLFHPFPARGPIFLVYFVAKVLSLFFVPFSSAIVDSQVFHKGASTQQIKKKTVLITESNFNLS